MNLIPFNSYGKKGFIQIAGKDYTTGYMQWPFRVY